MDRREPAGREQSREILECSIRTASRHRRPCTKSERRKQSPYLRGSQLLMSRLRKREWILSVYRKLNRLHPDSGEIDRRHKLSRDEFLREYYATNRPVIITGMMDDWPAMRKWNLDYFAEKFGDRDGRGPDESKRGRPGRPVRDQFRAIHRQDQVRRVRRTRFARAA